MTHVITQNCCNDAACVSVCPVNCIHPTPDELDYRTSEMLYIDPEQCIDCGACIDACPVTAIQPDYALPSGLARFEEINARYFEQPGRRDYEDFAALPPRRSFAGAPSQILRVAVVGAGPAACYAAGELLGQRDISVEVDMFERLLTPGGLVRFGVAPDHQKTKAVTDTFNAIMANRGFRLFAGVTVGQDITHDQLSERYHAVLYAVGALHARRLGIPGEDLSGSFSATEFVGWYNGHPDFADRTFDLAGDRVVVLGNGNVALDVARILTSTPERLAATDIADHAVAALRDSGIREVVVVGRRGAGQAAFTTPELLGLQAVPEIDVIVETKDLPAAAQPHTGSMTDFKVEVLSEIAEAGSNGRDRRVVLRFLTAPVEILGNPDSGVTGIRLARTRLVERSGQILAEVSDETEDLACSLVFRSVGYRGAGVPGVPLDETRGILPNEAGRVIDPATTTPVPGTYVAGWVKRGPSGVIGTNKLCAQETVASLLDDFTSGVLDAPTAEDDLPAMLPHAVDLKGWRAIDQYERAAGRENGRPRVKIVDLTLARSVAGSRTS